MTEEKKEEIWGALATVQAKLRTQPHTREVNVGKYGYTYTELSALCDYLMPLLGEAGIATTYTSSPCGESSMTISCRLTAWDGSHVEAATVMQPDAFDPQSVGKALTYGRRYCLQMVTGIATESDTDCAPVGAEHKPTPRASQAQTAATSTRQEPTPSTTSEVEDPNAASDKQKKMIWAVISKTLGNANRDETKAIVDAASVKIAGVRASQLTKKGASALIEWAQTATLADLAFDEIPF
jgi:hypothetical protein